jgi:capsular polysaccharide biosynthesis protein
MGDELDMAECWKILAKRKKTIMKWTILIVLIVGVISFLAPKTYESVSVIQLGEVRGPVLEPSEAKNLLESSIILNSVIDKFFANGTVGLEAFKKNNIEIGLITERLGTREDALSAIRITTQADSPIMAKEINEQVIKSFFNYTMPKYERDLNLTLEDFEQTKKDIERQESEIEQLKNEIDSLSSNELIENGTSKSKVLVNGIANLANYESILKIENDKKVLIEDQLNHKKEFVVLSEPQIPLKQSSPKTSLNILIALVSGLILSIALVFFQEAVKR